MIAIIWTLCVVTGAVLTKTGELLVLATDYLESGVGGSIPFAAAVMLLENNWIYTELIVISVVFFPLLWMPQEQKVRFPMVVALCFVCLVLGTAFYVAVKCTKVLPTVYTQKP